MCTNFFLPSQFLVENTGKQDINKFKNFITVHSTFHLFSGYSLYQSCLKFKSSLTCFLVYTELAKLPRTKSMNYNMITSNVTLSIDLGMVSNSNLVRDGPVDLVGGGGGEPQKGIKNICTRNIVKKKLQSKTSNVVNVQSIRFE